MSQKFYALISGWIFGAVAVGHALRLLYSWEVVVNNWVVPMWVSGGGVVVAAYLAYHGFRFSK